MRKNLGKEMQFLPLPVLIIGTYDKDGTPNAMNAAWGGIYDYDQVYISLAPHKTTENLEVSKAFTVSFATKKTAEIADYFGCVSGFDEDKIKKTGVHVSKSEYVNAPIIDAFPLCLECEVLSFENGNLIGNVKNVSIDEDYLNPDGSINVDKMEIISFDMINKSYRVLGEEVCKAFVGYFTDKK